MKRKDKETKKKEKRRKNADKNRKKTGRKQDLHLTKENFGCVGLNTILMKIDSKLQK